MLQEKNSLLDKLVSGQKQNVNKMNNNNISTLINENNKKLLNDEILLTTKFSKNSYSSSNISSNSNSRNLSSSSYNTPIEIMPKLNLDSSLKLTQNNLNQDINEIAKKKLIQVCTICLIFMLFEFLGGYFANSLAIMTDAAHLLSDLAGFIISIFSIYTSKLPANKNFNFGYYRAEVVGALFSTMIIWALSLLLVYEAISRMFERHHDIDGTIMLISASIGLIFNLLMAFVLHSDVNLIF